MKALRCESFGPPALLQLRELPSPVLKEDEVLVEVHAAAINMSDVKNVSGSMDHTTLPRTPGRDFAGIVVSGPETLIGTKVWGTGGDVGFTRDGSHATYIVIPRSAVQAKPKNLSMELAGAVGVTYVTAWLCVCDAAQTMPGETLLVIGAAGGVGSSAVQIGKWKGARVIGTVRSESDREPAHLAGADYVLLSTADLPQDILKLTEGRGANVIVDTVGGSMVETCLEMLAPKGRLTEISSPAQERRISFDLIKFYRRRAKLLGVDSRALDVSASAAVLRELTPCFESDALHPALTIETHPLENAIQAYERVLNRSAAGKVMLTPNKLQ
jgi:NADPH:quinone reductase-like Zn-dependent oxidoreductase